jgi:hypothetical protein
VDWYRPLMTEAGVDADSIEAEWTMLKTDLYERY